MMITRALRMAKSNWFRLEKQTTLHLHLTCFVHYFAVLARPKCELPDFTFFWRMRTPDNDFFIFFKNLNTVLKNSTHKNSLTFDKLSDME